MNVPANPVPQACRLLVFALPAVWATGRVLTSKVSDEAWSSRVLAPGVAAALWLLCVHAIAYVTHSFVIGFVAGTLIAAAPGALALTRAARERRWSVTREPFAVPPSPWLWVTAALTTAALAPAAFNFAFHDEAIITGHLSIAAEIQNGVYPPRHLTFPQFELRYHYGFDLLVAMVSSLGRIRLDLAVDAVTLACWFYSWCAAWVVGERMLGRVGGPVTATLLLLGGGFPYVCDATLTTPLPLGGHLVGTCAVDAMPINPTLVSYFFQHPWSLGLPVALTTIGLAAHRGGRKGAWRFCVLGGLLVALALSEFALFVSLAPALTVAELVASRRRGLARFVPVIAMLVVATLVASRLGGFFAPADGQGAGVVPRAGILGTLAGTFEWHLRSFGLLLPLAAAGAFWLRERLLCGLLAVGGVVVINAFTYEFTWDIVKFAVVAHVGLALLAAAAVVRLFGPDTRPLLKGAAACSLAAATASGLAFVFVFSGRPAEASSAFPRDVPAPVGDDAAAATWLRRREPGRHLVYVQNDKAVAYAAWAGIPQVWVGNAEGFPFRRERLQTRSALTAFPRAAPEDYEREGVRYFVLGKRDGALDRYADDWVASGKARVLRTFGELRLVALGDAPGG